jgi:hypothetical protein
MQQKPQYLEIVMEKGGKDKHYGTQKTKRERAIEGKKKRTLGSRERRARMITK